MKIEEKNWRNDLNVLKKIDKFDDSNKILLGIPPLEFKLHVQNITTNHKTTQHKPASRRVVYVPLFLSSISTRFSTHRTVEPPQVFTPSHLTLSCHKAIELKG
jgi:hypothetical protein